ncbi:MAG: septal ring lytic transglycosylase RlpA family protein [Candidatus Binatia bacterium]
MTSILKGVIAASVLVLAGATHIAAQDTATVVYYTTRLNGHRTANGERFDSNALTAAHKTYPFGTQLRLTHVRTKKKVVVRVNDRGPFTPGRDISITRRAARKLGILREGHAQVHITELPRNVHRKVHRRPQRR